MRNLWLFPHLSELETARHLVESTVAGASVNIRWELMGAGQISLEFWIDKLLDSPEPLPAQIALIGVAGALDPALEIGSLFRQTNEQTSLFLSPRPVESADDAKILLAKEQQRAVVMESLWSDQKLRARVLQSPKGRELAARWQEFRGISDHGEGLSLNEIRRRLPTALRTAVLTALQQTQRQDIAEPS